MYLCKCFCVRNFQGYLKNLYMYIKHELMYMYMCRKHIHVHVHCKRERNMHVNVCKCNVCTCSICTCSCLHFPCSIIQMMYYGRNDISLGDFVKRYCFRPDYRCQTCSSEMTKHQRHIVHGRSALHISVQQLDISIPRSNDGIFTWLACKHCTLVRQDVL